MITIFLNETKQTIPKTLNLYDFLIQNQLIQDIMAVTVNHTLVLRKDLKTTYLNDKDCVDILIPMQGG